MVNYYKSTPTYNASSGGYKVVRYSSVSNYNGVTSSGWKETWKKSICCQSFAHGGSRCSDCPGY